MGGLAIKTITGKEARRITKDERNILIEKINKLFSSHFFAVDVVTEIKEKETYGDIDFLTTAGTKLYAIPYMKALFGDKYQGVHKNGNIWSFAIDDAQIDFIFLSEEDSESIEAAKFYFSNNDMGNLIGRIARSIGLKFGHKGLILPILDGENTIDEMVLETNYKEILYFLGFDYEKYPLDGFDTFLDMYNFITNSDLFDGSIYDLDKLNQANRIRNVKRKTYMDFIEFLNNNPELKNKKSFDPISKEFYKHRALLYFNKTKEYSTILMKNERKKLIAKKFYGKIVKELTGLEGIELGNFIKKFKGAKDEFYFRCLSQEQIKKDILKMYGEQN
jgi:hypothetical protein